jgi:hypothetical protein
MRVFYHSHQRRAKPDLVPSKTSPVYWVAFSPHGFIRPIQRAQRSCVLMLLRINQREKVMRKILATICLSLLLASAALADTLYLKSGAVIKGTFVGYENGKFVFLQDNGNRTEWTPQQVNRLELDSYRASGNTGNTNSGYPTRNPGGWTSHPELDVRLEDQWIRSNITVRNGQRVRVDATGSIALEGRTTTGPEGLRSRADQYAPEPNEMDGVLLAGVGQDSSTPSIVVGRSKEFIADRDGMLYFTVNHGETRNARGTFKVRVQVDPNSGYATPPTPAPTNPATTGQERTITVSGTQPWTDTGIDVQPNMTFEIIAEGTIGIGANFNSVGPDGEMRAQVASSRYPVQDRGVGGVIAKIRLRNGADSNILYVGRQGGGTTEPNEYGRLLIGINDDYFKDNSGSFTVRLRW